jgi:O-antigen/teichoic acid export membrane protein
MVRQFLANLSILVLLNLFIKPLYVLGIEVAVQNAVGTTTFGLFFALLNSAYLLQIFNDFGLQIYNNRLVAIDSAQISISFRKILRLKSFLAILFILCLLLLMRLLGYQEYLDLAIPIGANLILVSFILFLRSTVSGLGLYRQDSILSVLDKVLMIAICGYMLFLSDITFTIYHFVYAQMVSFALTVAAAVGLLIHKKAFVGKLQQPGDLKPLLRKAAPFAIAVFLMSIYTRVDAVMIEQIADRGKYQSGMYAAGYRLLDAANMFAYLFAVLLLPMFTRLLSKREETIALMSQAFRLMWVLTIITVAISFVYRDPIMSFLYSESTQMWADTFGLLILSFVAIGLMYVFGTYLTARGELKSLNILYASCVVLNIVLNFALIPRHGAYGAAMATLATQSVVTISLIVMSITKLKPSVDFKLLVRIIEFAIGTGAIVVLPGYINLELDWPFQIAILVPAILILAIITGTVRPKEIMGFVGRGAN